MITISTAPDPKTGDIPVWKRIEVGDGERRVVWCVRLWTGELRKFSTKKAAVAAYWM